MSSTRRRGRDGVKRSAYFATSAPLRKMSHFSSLQLFLMRLCFLPALCLLLFLRGITLHGDELLLTRASDVRALSVTEARMEKEARLTGTVVYVERTGILVQDETASTFFRPTEQQLSLKVGDEVEVRGKTQMGRYFAGLGPSEVRVLGHASEPPTISVEYDDIVSARYFYQRVAVEGIVRSIEQKKDWIAVRLAMGPRILEVRFARPSPPNQNFVDARVRIKGISAGSINDQRQLIETFLRIQSWDDIEVIDPPTPADGVTRLKPEELLAFRPNGRPERRISVSGVVTAVFPKREIYLQQERTAFAARLAQTAELSVGDRVDLLGFVEVFQFAASVVDAEVRRSVPGTPPLPVAVASPDLLNSSHDTRLVTVEARIADAFKSPEGHFLVLADKKRTIQAYVPAEEILLAAGALVRVTGICHVELMPSPEFLRQPGAIHLKARSARDVLIVEAPRWWTPRKLMAALGVLAGVILIAGIWNVALHRQVRRKTEALRERIESEAALEERQRIAQEFHDTLEQDLTGLGLRLDSAATRAFDENGRKIMAVSRSLLARIQAETKNIVSNLRDPAPLETDLVTALEEVVKNSAGLVGLETELQVVVRPPALSGSTLHHLHMMARESVNNALKHANASRIVVAVTVEQGRLMLRISDNGRGLDNEAVTRGKSGHFGCVGIRTRPQDRRDRCLDQRERAGDYR